MDKVGQKFGVFDINTKIFYTIPAANQEEFNQIIKSLEFLRAQKHQEKSNPKPETPPVEIEKFDDFDLII